MFLLGPGIRSIFYNHLRQSGAYSNCVKYPPLGFLQVWALAISLCPSCLFTVHAFSCSLTLSQAWLIAGPPMRPPNCTSFTGLQTIERPWHCDSKFLTQWEAGPVGCRPSCENPCFIYEIRQVQDKVCSSCPTEKVLRKEAFTSKEETLWLLRNVVFNHYGLK